MTNNAIKIAAFLFVALFATDCLAGDVYVNGYTRRDGTYVNGYHRTSPDSNPYNNYSTKGNTNPYTGNMGTTSPSVNYGAPRGNYVTYNHSLPPINANGVGANLGLRR